MTTTQIPVILQPELTDELLGLIAGNGAEPSPDLFDLLADASGRSKRDLEAEYGKLRQLVVEQMAVDHDAHGYGTKG